MDDEKEFKMNPDDLPDDGLDLEEVARVWGLAEADVIKSFLESNGIACIFRGRVVPSIYPLATDGMGEIRILVKAGDLETARELLEKTEIPPEQG
jgi:hypothetical protein